MYSAFILLGLLFYLAIMVRAGKRKSWRTAALATLPFVVLIIYTQFALEGPGEGPVLFFLDPYGFGLFVLMFAPIVIGWSVFFSAFLIRRS